MTWGEPVGVDDGAQFRIGYEIKENSGQTLSITFYIQTKWRVADQNNTFKYEIGSDITGETRVSILTSKDLGKQWTDEKENIREILTVNKINISNFNISASLTGIDTNALGGYTAKVSGKYYTMGSPSLEITDRGDNYAVFHYTFPETDEDNPITLGGLYWTTNGQIPEGDKDYTKFVEIKGESESEGDFSVEIPENCNTIVGIIYVYAQQLPNNPTHSGNVSLSVKYYSKPILSDEKIILKYKKNKPTLTENLKFVWGSATASNANSPVEGYNIKIFKNNDELIESLTIEDPTITFYELNNDLKLKLKAKDRIYLKLQSYSLNGKGEQLTTDFDSSSIYTIGNSGVLNIKNSNTWIQGQVWVKTNDGWKEATDIYIKNNGNWKNSI